MELGRIAVQRRLWPIRPPHPESNAEPLQEPFSGLLPQADLASSVKCSTDGGDAKNGPTIARQLANAGDPRKSTV